MKTLFAKVVNTFKNEDIREFALYCMENLPEYFWSIPASTSGKYHPITDFDEKYWNEQGLQTRYYNTDLHKGAFYIPNYVKELLEHA